MKNILFLFFLGAVAGTSVLSAQDIQTASEFFAQVGENYAAVDDYISEIVVTTEDGVMRGTLYYKRPNLMLIEFSQPEDQVIVSNGSVLTVYVPSLRQALRQPLRANTTRAESLATPQGLLLMRREFAIAYLSSPEPEPLDDPDEDAERLNAPGGSSEPVTKLTLDRGSPSAGFRQLNVSVGADGFIRRIVGVTVDFRELQFDFLDVTPNQGIPDALFEWEVPPEANVYDNFLGEIESAN